MTMTCQLTQTSGSNKALRIFLILVSVALLLMSDFVLMRYLRQVTLLILITSLNYRLTGLDTHPSLLVVLVNSFPKEAVLITFSLILPY